MKLENKVAVVTGGAKGLGQSIAELFAGRGARVIAADVIALGYKNSSVEGYRLDVSSSGECRSFFDYITEKYKKIDILVNNAGITRDALTEKMSDDMWESVINVNLSGAFYLTRIIGPHMQKNNIGSIINISSYTGEHGNIGQANYAASKAGMIGLTKSWAKEFAMKDGNVRVNAIAPGCIQTDMVQSVPQEIMRSFANSTALKRIGLPVEVAKAALFLASDDASYITGHVLHVDGGMNL